ncbi:MAG: hypothetical protein HY321_17605 [Armatimonadetes bacterium]|nr:hypothetical protein [Armatimonadota bacterium]
MHLNKRRLAWLPALALATAALAAVIAGCGSSKRAAGTPSYASGTGTAVINIAWPPREGDGESRVIPAVTESILIRVFTDRELTALRRVITRPEGAGNVAARFEGLPAGPVLFVAQAFAVVDPLALAQLPQPLASGSQTVTITPNELVPVSISLLPTGTGTDGGATAGFATVTITGIPVPAAGSTVTVLLEVRHNGQVLTGDGTSARFEVPSGVPVSAVPLRLGPLPEGSLLFVGRADDGGGTMMASGSAIGAVAGDGDAGVTLPLSQGTGGSTSGAGATDQPATTGSAVVTANNVAAGDVVVTVTPISGAPGTSRQAVSVTLPSGVAGLPIESVPVLVGDLQPGPWLFVVTTQRPSAADPSQMVINRVGSTTASVKAGELLNLAVPLGTTQQATPALPPGTLNVLVTNIAGLNLSTLLVAVFDSAGQPAKSLALPQTPGINQRLVTFTLPGGAYTVVAAAYTTPPTQAVTTTIPPGALSIGSSTAQVTSGENKDIAVELRLQGGSPSFGSVNLAMLQVPLRIEMKSVSETQPPVPVIASGIVVKVFSVLENQELTALQRTMMANQYVQLFTVPANDPTGTPVAAIAGPVRLRIDGVPVGAMRFEVTSTYDSTGAPPVLGNGSAIATIVASADPAAPALTPVTVTVLPHGILPPGTVLPGTISDDPTGQNPPPRLRARIMEWFLYRR